ncbi:hypothetical protein [Enterococcus larvae]|uniref:hypothetical protein n=1 Tax=Enterococcus larvae TaxID=2794352 RepID=UPI003F37A28E
MSKVEELQKKADKYDELSKHLEFTVKSFEEQQTMLQEQINFEKLKNQGSPLAEAAEDMKKLGKAFGDAMDRNKRMSAVARLLEEFLESDWDFHDESETEQGAMEYAKKILEIFEEQNEPVTLPKWIVEEYFEENPFGWVSTVVTHVMSDGRMGKDSKMIAADAREVEKILCVAFATGNYTVKHELKWVITNGSRYLEEIIWRSRKRAESKGPAFHEELWNPDTSCAIKFDDEKKASGVALLVDGNAVPVEEEPD